MYKKLLSIVIAVCMVFTMLPMQVFADGAPTIKVGDGVVDIADGTATVQVPVEISNNSGFGGLEFFIDIPDGWSIPDGGMTARKSRNEYSIFFKEDEWGDMQQFVTPEFNTATGKVVAASNQKDNITTNGVICWVTFSVPAEIFDGDYSVGITPVWINTATETSVNIMDQFTFEPGTITVTGGLGESTLTPVITDQPRDAEYTYAGGEEIVVAPLSVSCADVEGTLSYQWYTNAGVASNQYGLPIAGATESTYTPELQDDFLTLYYYCVVTNTYAGHIYSVTSDYAGITYKRCPISLSMELPVPVKGGDQVVGGYGPTWHSTIRWAPEPESGVFEANTVYTATIEVAAYHGYEFINELPTLTYRGTPGGELISYDLNDERTLMTLVVEYDPTEAAVLESIAVTTPPTKTQYFAGDSFDPAGMVVTGYYDDGTYAEITEYVITPGTLTEDTTEVTISCGGKSTTVTVDVLPNSMTSIEITELPAKTVYTVGDSADWTGLEVTATYANGDTRALNVGEYTVTGFDSSKYDAEQTITVTAGGLTDTFTITVNRVQTQVEDFAISIPVDAVYNGNPWAVTVTPMNGTLDYGTITVKYNGSTTAPTSAGSYKVTVSTTQTDTNTALAETLVGSMIVAPAKYTEVWAERTVTVYNGDGAVAKALPGLPVECIDGSRPNAEYKVISGADLIKFDSKALTVSGNGNGLEGTAIIEVTVTAPNHVTYVYEITITVLNKTDVSNDIVFDFVGAFAPVYDGNEFTMADFFNAATYNGSSEGILYEYNGRIYRSLSEIKGRDAGTYTVTARYLDETSYGSKTLSLTVDKCMVEIPAAVTSLVYNGTEQTGVIATDLYTVEGGSATDAGTYVATLTLTDPDNYRWMDIAGDSGTRTVTWTIDKATIDVSGYEWNYNPGAFTYDGSDKSVTLEYADSKLNVTYSNSVKRDAGTYTATASVAVKTEYAKNYQVVGAVKDLSWSIAKASIDVSDYTWNYTNAFTYDGTVKTVVLNGADSKLTVTYSDNSKTAAGTYTAKAAATVKDEYAGNYQVVGSIKNLTWSIAKAVVAVPNTDVSYVFDGTEKTAVAEHALYTISGANKGTNAGGYTVTVTLKDAANYKWSDESFSGTFVWRITKAAAQNLTAENALRYSNTAEQSYGSADVLALLANAGTVTITGVQTAANDILAADAAIKNGAVSYALKSGLTAADKDKTAVLTITFTSTNYEESTVKLTVKVMDKVDVSDKITFVDGSAVYNGQVQKHETAKYNGQSSSNIRYEYSADPKNVGTYTVTAIYEDADNYGSKTATFTITPATLTISGAEAADKIYDGTTDAEITNVTFMGLCSNDAVDYTVTSAAFADKNVGVNKTVTYTVALAEDVINYTLKTATATTTAGISCKEITVTIERTDDKQLVYNGTAQEPEVVILGHGTYEPFVLDRDYTVKVSNNVNAGTGVITVSPVKGSNYTFEVTTLEFTIAKQGVELPTAVTGLIYNGKTQTGVADGDKYSVVGGTQTNAGDYTATVKLDDPANYKWNGLTENESADQTIVWSIAKAVVAVPNTDVSYVFDGTEKTAVAEHALYTISGANKGTNAGGYTVTVTLKDAANYKWSDESFSGTFVWRITKAAAQNLTGETSLRYSNTAEQSYGSADVLALLANAGTVTITGVQTAANDILAADAAIKNGAVSYALKSGLTATDKDKTAVLTITFTSTNYEDSTVTLTVKVMDKVDVSGKLTFEDGSAVYNGQVQKHETAKYNGQTSSNIRYEYSADPKNVGTYTVTAIYEDADNYGSKTATFTITPATLTISGAEAADKIYDGTTDAEITNVTFRGLCSNDAVDYTVTSAAFADKNVGVNKTVTYTVALNGQTAVNYKLASASDTASADIEPKSIEVSVAADDTDLVYDGTAQKPELQVSSDDLEVGDTLAEGIDYTVACSGNVNAGTGTVTVTAVKGSNYVFAPAQDTFTIGKAEAPALTVDGMTSFKYTASGEYSVAIVGVPADANGADYTLGNPVDIHSVIGSLTNPNNGVITFTLNGLSEYADGITATIPVTVEMGNYKTATVNVVLTIKDKDVPTAVAADLTITYTGETLTNEAIKGSAGVNGAWEWVTDPATLVDAGTYTAEVKFVPADSANYAEVIDTITVTVNKADVTGRPHYTTIDEAGKTLADAELSIGTLTPAEGTLVWLDSEGNPVADPAAVEIQSGVKYTWQYTPDNANYNLKTGEVILYTAFVVPPVVVVPQEPVYEPVIEDTEGGEVAVSPAKPEEGDEVVITPAPDTGKEVGEVIVVAGDGSIVPVTDNGDGTYTFTQPEGVVTITVTFKCDGETNCPAAAFTDVNTDLWYHEAVDYVVSHGLFKGTSATTFSPLLTMTRGMLATVLHNLESNPEHYLMGLFTDVPAGKYYSVPVEWAAANGIMEGYGNDVFGPNDALTREQLVVVLWRYAGRPESSGSYDRFSDADQVSSWAEEAMCWAVENGIINGKSDEILDPKGEANRAQVAQMLMNYLESLNK